MRRLLIPAAVVVALVAANVAAYGRGLQIDLSANHRFRLTSDSTALAKAVRSPLAITAFLSNVGGAGRDADFLLARYHEINSKITYRVVDPDAHPGEARRFGVGQYATVVMTYRGRRVDAPDAEELAISTAILRLLRGTTPTVCNLVGHGEPSFSDTAPQGLSTLDVLLTQNGYHRRPLDLTTGAPIVPADCAAIVIIGPVDPLLPQEVSALNAWTQAGGKLMLLASPLTRGDPNPLLAPWGIHFVGGLVLDPARDQGLDLSNVIVEDLPSASPVNRGIDRLQFPAGGGLVVDAGTTGGLTVERLAVTSGQSWVESRPDQEQTLDPSDIPGPVTVAAAADASHLAGPKGTGVVRTRVFATGGVPWVTNQFIDNLGNRRLIVNALSWLTEGEQLVAATSRPNAPPALPLTPERRTEILFWTVGVVPGLIVGAGLTSSYARRKNRR
jgi:hypothetical protein